MPPKLKTALDDIVQVVNLIKARPLNSRLFHMICEDMGSVHIQLLLHAEVRWLSRGKVLTSVFELRNEIGLYFSTNCDKTGNAKKHADHFNDFEWLSMVAYLADIFSALNSLNLSLQGGNDVNIFSVENKIEAMLKKLELWANRSLQNNYDHFPTLSSFLLETGEAMQNQTKQLIIEHLRTMKSSFRNYFPIPEKQSENWILDPFNVSVSDVIGLTPAQENQLIDISCDSYLKRTFSQCPLTKFWLNINSDYNELSELALKKFLPFATTYLCEKGFSTLVYLKNKYRNRLQVEPDLRIILSSITPNITVLASKKQHQPSH